jgi:hypothetical protein
MTQTASTDAPTSNRGGVLLTSVGALSTLAVVVGALGLVPGVFAFGLNFVVLPIVLVIAAVPLAFGASRVAGVAGSSRSGRILFLAWAALSAVSQLAFIIELGSTLQVAQLVEIVRLFIAVLAIVAGVTAAVAILLARVAVGFARVSLFLAVLLFAVTELGYLGAFGAFGLWGDLPRAVGLLVLGLSYWRVGLPITGSVPDRYESLAE